MTLEKLDGYHSQRLEKVRVPWRTCAIVAPLGVQHRRGPFCSFGAQTKGAAEEDSTSTVSTTGGKDGSV